MSGPESKKRKTRSSGTLLEKAGFLIALGLLFLFVPRLFETSPGLLEMQAGLRLPGLLALGIGLVLLGVDRVRKRRTTRTQSGSSQSGRP
jgi:hypothetical protein